jgi:hypothetical protein
MSRRHPPHHHPIVPSTSSAKDKEQEQDTAINPPEHPSPNNTDHCDRTSNGNQPTTHPSHNNTDRCDSDIDSTDNQPSTDTNSYNSANNCCKNSTNKGFIGSANPNE